MNLGSNTDIVEELQRQLHAANSRNTQLEQLLSVDLSLDPSILGGTTETQPGFQLPNYGVNSSSLSRSKSTVGYPSRLSMMVCRSSHSSSPTNFPGPNRVGISSPQATKKSLLSTSSINPDNESQHVESFRVANAIHPDRPCRSIDESCHGSLLFIS